MSGLGLPQTKGIFKLRGFATELGRDNAYIDKTDKNGNPFHMLQFAVQTAPESKVYVNLMGGVRGSVYYSKPSKEKGKKSETTQVAWDKRFTKPTEDSKLIGISVGLKKDESGKKNITEVLTEFDATEKIHNELKDETPVFVRGDIDFSSFTSNNGDLKRSTKFNIKNIYLSDAGALDFAKEDFVPINEFKQKIVFMGIEKVDDNDDPHYVVSAKIVKYNSIEDAEFIIREKGLANTFKKNLKPYTAIDVWGEILNKVETEEEETTDIWGEQDSFKTVNKNYIRELVIKGADPGTIDAETYNQKVMDEVLKALDEFGDSSIWGNDDPSFSDIPF